MNRFKIFIGLFLFLQPVLFSQDSVSGPGGTYIGQFLDEGVPLNRRTKVNWTGAGVSCVDNSGAKRLDCTISTTGGGSVGSATFAINYNNILVSSPTSNINFMSPLIATLQGTTSAQITLGAISLSTGVVGSVDISTQTNLTVTSPVKLTNDTLSLELISLSTGVVGPLSVSSGTVTRLYSSTITFSDGSVQTTAAPAASGDITAVIAGTGLTGGALSGNATLNQDPATTLYIWNTGSLQTGATAYPGFLEVGSAGAVIHGPLNVTGVITASSTVITTAAGLLDSTKLTNTIPNSLLDSSSVTLQGNTFNAANKLLQLDGSADVPDANLSANVSLLGNSIDISAETNLGAISPLSITGDSVAIDTTSLAGSFIGNQSTLQSGATFYVSDGTIRGKLKANNIVLPDNTTVSPQIDSSVSDGTIFIRLVTDGISASSYINSVYSIFGSTALGNRIQFQPSIGRILTLDGSSNVLSYVDDQNDGGLLFGNAVGFNRVSPKYPLDIYSSSSVIRNNYYWRVNASVAPVVITLPDIQTIGSPQISNYQIVFCKSDSSTNTVSFAGNTLDTVQETATLYDSQQCVMLISSGTNGSDVGNWYVGMRSNNKNVYLNENSSLKFGDADDSNYVAFKASPTVASNVSWTLPSADGTANQTWITNGAGVLSFGVTLGSGTFTPTLTNVANAAASTAYSGQYSRVGEVVTFSFKVDIDPTLAATSTQVGVSLPVSSNFTADSQASGTCFATGVAGMGAAVIADATNDRLQIQYISSDITNQPLYCTATYRVL